MVAVWVIEIDGVEVVVVLECPFHLLFGEVNFGLFEVLFIHPKSVMVAANPIACGRKLRVLTLGGE